MMIVTAVRAGLALVFALALYLLWKSKKGTLRRLSLPMLICVFLLLALLSWLASDLLPLPTEQIQITAVGLKNEKSGNNEIYLTSIKVGGEVSEFRVSGEGRWFWTGNWYVWRNAEDPRRPVGVTNSFVMEMPIGRERRINFLSNRNKGYVLVEYNNEIQWLDCYSKEEGTASVEIGDTPQSVQIAALLRQVGMFAGLFVILALICILSLSIAERRERRKASLTRDGKIDSADQTEIPSNFRKHAIPIACFGVVALIVAVFFHPSFAIPKEEFAVMAMNTRNTKSSSDDICLISMVENNKEYDAELLSSGDWKPEGKGYVWHDSDRSDTWMSDNRRIRLQLPVGRNRSVTLLKNAGSGYAQLDYDDQIWFLDCYAAEEGTVTVKLPSSSDQMRMKCGFIELLMILCISVPLFIALYLPYQLVIVRKEEQVKEAAEKAWSSAIEWLRQDDVVWARRLNTLVFLISLIIATNTLIRMLK